MACCGARPRVSSRDAPILIGEPDGSLLRARATVNVSGVRPGEVAWFTGATVAGLVASQVLIPV